MKKNPNAIKNTRGDNIIFTVNNIILMLFMVIVLVPVVFVVAASFSSAEDVIAGRVLLWPVNFNLEGYTAVFQNGNITTGFVNSFLYMIIETCVGLVLTILAAFPLSKKGLPGGSQISFFFTFTMLFNGGLIPSYLLISSTLGWKDSILAVTIPTAMSVYNVIIMRSYFRNNIPDEIYEAASIDGCSVFRYLISFVLPLSGPIIAIIVLYIAVASWNSWFNAMLYITTSAKRPLQLVLRDILINSQIDMSMVDPDQIERMQNLQDLLKYSLIVVSSLPMMMIYPFIQKYFVKGVMAGAVKG